MRLVTFDAEQGPRVGAIHGEAVIDLHQAGQGQIPADMIAFIEAGAAALSRAKTIVDAAAGAASRGGIPFARPLASVRLLAPIPRPRKNVFCVGRNYLAHIEEGARARGTQVERLEVPTYFTKAPTSVIGPDAPIVIEPEVSTSIDFEGELAVIVGRRCRNLTPDQARDAIFGYTLLNDVTARDLQRKHGQWFKGKTLDTFCPLGPCIVTRDEVADPQALTMTVRLNGQVMQHANTAQMIFPIDVLLVELTKGLTLEPGDIVATGTPEGVGFARTPPVFMKAGDVVEVEVEGIGVLRNPVR